MSRVWLFAIAALGLLSAGRLPPPDCASCAHPLVADGFRADSSSPFILQGELIGHNAIWQLLIGPVDSAPVATIPPFEPTFGGAGCRAEYRQGRIAVPGDDGGSSSLTLDVYLFRCDPSSPSGASLASGSYSVIGGTGRFSGVTGGTGSIQFDTRSDGRVYCHIQGFVQGGPPRGDAEP